MCIRDSLQGDGRATGVVPSAQSKTYEFHVRPQVERVFLAKFRISYDDQLRAGRSMEFADQVALVQVTEKYQPIPNPYHAGRPLPCLLYTSMFIAIELADSAHWNTLPATPSTL